MSRTRLIRRQMLLGSAALGAGMLSLARRAEATTDTAQRPVHQSPSCRSPKAACMAPAMARSRYSSACPMRPIRSSPPTDSRRRNRRLPGLAHETPASTDPCPPNPRVRRGGGLAGEPDDLTLNIWALANAQNAPVLVWFPGGAFYRVDAAEGWYDGSSFANQGIVVVTVNDRVGIDGFMAVDGMPANRGLLDQVAALQWIRQNIAAFRRRCRRCDDRRPVGRRAKRDVADGHADGQGPVSQGHCPEPAAEPSSRPADAACADCHTATCRRVTCRCGTARSLSDHTGGAVRRSRRDRTPRCAATRLALADRLHR